ncbi:invasion associated locus B family protein [Rhizobium sp. FKY42]|uniref:invasion associated locus B family protein n=1 Tax=Rhizobium sp. FKY42 TaxID=2562310 RepID=UPI0010C04FF2|nr:invasion associated locus B family protein [Rhizobium sp. FKY42]
MSPKTYALAATIALLSTSAFAAQPNRIKQFDAWGVYSYGAGGTKNCYVLSVPVEQRPTNVSHGDNFFLVAPQAGQSGMMPQAIMGYDLKEGSKLTVTIGSDTFTMLPKEKAAWVRDPQREPALVAAMQSGSDMTVQATSARGTDTSYTYSLKGVSAALGAVRNCR